MLLSVETISAAQPASSGECHSLLRGHVIALSHGGCELRHLPIAQSVSLSLLMKQITRCHELRSICGCLVSGPCAVSRYEGLGHSRHADAL